MLQGVQKRDYEVDPMASLRERVLLNNSKVEPEEQEVLVQSLKDFWLEMCES